MIEEGKRTEALAILKDKFRGSEELIIIDAYFFVSPSEVTKEELINEILDTLPNSLEKLLIISSIKNNFTIIYNEFKRKFKRRFPNCQLDVILLSKIHDRVWINNNNNYLIVGTSFNGLGKSFSFIYSLQMDENKINVNNYFIKKIRASKVKIPINNQETIETRLKNNYLNYFIRRNKSLEEEV